jgi:hypothetical protein
MRPPPQAEAWDPHRLEHRFHVAAAAPAMQGGGTAEVTLSAPGFGGGHLDWPEFDVAAGVALGAAATTAQRDAAAVPTPVRYPGMPNARWWQFEDGAVDIGGADVAPEDLGRLVLLEFALVYGNDFLQVPVDLPVGSLCWVDRLTVMNTSARPPRSGR